MKKFFKKFLFFICCSLLVITGVFSYSAISSASASSVIPESTHTVNFYGADNETVIKSYEVPHGSSLNDYNNNLLDNADFSYYLNSSVSVTKDSSGYSPNNNICGNNTWYWILGSGSSTASFTFFNNGLVFNSSQIDSENSSFSYIRQPIHNLKLWTYITYSASVNNVVYTHTFSVPVSKPTSYKAFGSPTFKSLFYFRLEYQVSSDVWYFNLNSVAGKTFTINWCKVEYGTEATPFYSSDYLTKLYNSTSDYQHDNISWSTSLSEQKDFSIFSKINSDLNLYVYRPNINFYGADNTTILKTYDMFYEDTLNKYDNNIIKNGGFILSSDTSYFNWGVSSSSVSYTLDYQNNIFSSTGTTPIYLVQNLSADLLESNNHYTISIIVDNVLYRNTFYFSTPFTTAKNYVSITLPNSIGWFRLFYVPSTDVIQPTLHLNPGKSCSFDLAKLEKGRYNTPFFESDYVNSLYSNSGGVIGSDFEWSVSRVSSSKFGFNMPIKYNYDLYGYNYGESTFEYSAEISSDVSNLSNYAVNSIEFLEYSGGFLYHLICYESSDILTFYTATKFTDDLIIQTKSFVFNNNNPFQFFNLFIYSDNLFYVIAESGSEEIQVILNVSEKNPAHIYLSNLEFVPTSYNSFEFIYNSDYAKPINDRVYDNLEDIVDMSSLTNFSITFKDNDFGRFNRLIIDSINNNDSISVYNSSMVNGFIQYLDSSDEHFKFFYDGDLSIYSFNLLNPIYTSDSRRFVFNDIYFYVHRPFYRVDNTLVVYNFDYYNSLANIDFVNFQLQKNGNLYNVNYNGDLPNEYFIYLYNKDLSNTIFDEYVSVYLGFKDNFVYLQKLDSDEFGFKFGFDFNFTYYVEPLVTNKGSYNYTFEKPGFVEMKFNLVPLHLPVLEMVENAVIFLIFYCPVISDIISFLHFDMFFGGLVRIFNFVLNSGVGDFALACFAFILYWSILKGLFPRLYGSGKSIIVSKYSDYVSKRDLKRKNVTELATQNFLKALNYKPRKIKPYHIKSGLGDNFKNRLIANHLSRFNYLGYRGKRNSSIKKSMIAISKSKIKRR